MKQLRAWAPAALWMGVIFIMSAAPGDVSGAQSGMLVKLALSSVSFLFGEQAASAVSIDMLHLLVRKAAHMAEYAILFFLYHRALRQGGAKRPGAAALILCAAYAATDEIHQGFVAGRGPSAVDVGIDTLGAAAMWGLTAFINRIRKERRYGCSQ